MDWDSFVFIASFSFFHLQFLHHSVVVVVCGGCRAFRLPFLCMMLHFQKHKLWNKDSLHSTVGFLRATYVYKVIGESVRLCIYNFSIFLSFRLIFLAILCFPWACHRIIIIVAAATAAVELVKFSSEIVLWFYDTIIFQHKYERLYQSI